MEQVKGLKREVKSEKLVGERTPLACGVWRPAKHMLHFS
jgi:hypothetical protein